jgi:hypothetical protein
MSVAFDFCRLTRTYFPDENIHVDATVTTSESIKYKSVSCSVFCVKTLEPKGHGLSGFESGVPHSAEQVIWELPIKKDWPRTLENGYKFAFDFQVPRGKNMSESVRGKYVSIDYIVELNVKMGMLKEDITCARGFFILYPPPATPPAGQAIEKLIDSSALKKGSPRADFKAKVVLATNVASFKKPPSGTITLLESKVPIKARSVSYVRTEKILEKGNVQAFDAEVCRIQIAETDPPHGIELPFNLEWVRLLIGPDLETAHFAISVGLKVRIVFDNDAYASAVIPLKLWRDLPY